MTSGTRIHRPKVVIVGGGFFGCCLALYLRSVTPHVTIVEAGSDIMTRASKVNQARVHTGYHYPRNMLTAAKSALLHRRFVEDFPEAIVSNVKSLYAVARRNSKVSPGRFQKMFREMGLHISPASPVDLALFDQEHISSVFECVEYVFDYRVLRDMLKSRVNSLDIDLRLNTLVGKIADTTDRGEVKLDSGETLHADLVFNITYAQLNQVLENECFLDVPLKHELAELVLVEPPEELRGRAVTVMDGPFFQCSHFRRTSCIR